MAVQKTECYRVVTIGYLKSFIGTNIQNSTNGSAISISRTDDTYCPTYSELTGGTIIQTWKPGDTPNGDRDGITVNETAVLGGNYASNQLVDQRDLGLKYTRFSGLTISVGKITLSGCGDSTTVSYGHKYLRYTKSMNSNCATGTTSAEASDTACREVHWHPSLGTVSSCNTYTIEKNSSSTGKADARPITLYAEIEFRGSSGTSNTVNMTQSALDGRWVSYNTAYTIDTTTDGEAYDSCSAQEFSVGGTGVTKISYYWEDYCGKSYPDITTATTDTTVFTPSGGSFSAWDCCNGPHTAVSSFTFNYGTNSKTVTFTQNCADCSSSCGAPACRVSSDKYLFSDTGGTATVQLKDNDTSSILSATWSVTPSAGVTINGNNITFPANTTSSDIEYTVQGTNGSCTATKLITVAGTSGPSPCSLVVTDSTYIKLKSKAYVGATECDSAYMYKGNVNVTYNPASASTWLTYKITWQDDPDWSSYVCSDYRDGKDCTVPAVSGGTCVAYQLQDKLGLPHDMNDPNLCSISYIATQNTGNDRECTITYAINGQPCSHQVRVVQEGSSGPIPPTPTGCECSNANFSVTGKSVNAGTNVVVANYTANCTDGATVGFRGGDNFLEGGIWLSNGSIIAGKVNSHTENLSGNYGIYVNGDRCASFTVTSPGEVASCASYLNSTVNYYNAISCTSIGSSAKHNISFRMSGYQSECYYSMQVEATDSYGTQAIPFSFTGDNTYTVTTNRALIGNEAQITIGGIVDGEIWAQDWEASIPECSYAVTITNNSSVSLENITCTANFSNGTTASFQPVNLSVGDTTTSTQSFSDRGTISSIDMMTISSPYNGTLRTECYSIESGTGTIHIYVKITCATIY